VVPGVSPFELAETLRFVVPPAATVGFGFVTVSQFWPDCVVAVALIVTCDCDKFVIVRGATFDVCVDDSWKFRGFGLADKDPLPLDPQVPVPRFNVAFTVPVMVPLFENVMVPG
jgi:hypothetical protein